MRPLPAVLIITLCLASAAWANGYNSGNILSNDGFEKGDLSEAANNGMGRYPWFSANSGGNAIAATGKKTRSGAFSLEWSPIGWNVKDDGTAEDACTFIVAGCGEYTLVGADAIRLSGFINTSSLKSKFSAQVILANDTFSRWNVETILRGGVADWQAFNVTMPVRKEDKFIFAAFKILGTTGVGAGDSAVHIDDLSLVYTGRTSKTEKRTVEEVKEVPAVVKERPFFMGFTPFPWDTTPAAVNSTYKGIIANGDIICHHFDGGVPWPEALEDKPFSAQVRSNWKRRKDGTPENFKVFVAVTPLDMFRKGMALYHGEKENMPLPKSFKGKAFDDPDVMKAYLNYCRRAVEYFSPDYLAIGIEVNELVHNSAGKWPGFVRLYKYVYGELRRDHPQMPIFATFTLHNMLQENWSDIETQRKKVREFLTEVDLVGISFYPFMKTLGDPERPVEAFDWIRKFVGDKPIAITETGFPAEPTRLEDFNVTLPGSPQGQAKYIETLLSTACRERYRFVIAFLYRDYDALWEKIKVGMSGDWASAWRDCGLVDGEGTKRRAHEVWRRYLRAKYLRRQDKAGKTKR
ncbi:MAG TPA: hypothetical protein VMY06_10500 [Sedimentisphaerales bacterium]|nr:hypothetical protein [Sedimentisphaerales bacterium]